MYGILDDTYFEDKDVVGSLVRFFKLLKTKHWTGQIRINIINGSISGKIEKKESVRIFKG